MSLKLNKKALVDLENRIGSTQYLLWCAVLKYGPITIPEMAEITGRPLIGKLVPCLEELDLITSAATEKKSCTITGFELPAWTVVESHLLFDEPTSPSVFH